MVSINIFQKSVTGIRGKNGINAFTYSTMCFYRTCKLFPLFYILSSCVLYVV